MNSVCLSMMLINSGPLKAIGQLSHDGIGRKIFVKFVISHWSVSICLLSVKLVEVRILFLQNSKTFSLKHYNNY